MIKTLAKSIREFKLPSILTPIFMIFEVIIECLLPFIIANLINDIKAGCDLSVVLKNGGIMAICAVISLSLGAAGAVSASKAGAGFARNLRHDLFYKIQTYSFDNIDKFSSSSLVTRLTTDVGHVQMSYMMIIRTAIRSPLMFTFSIIMAYIMGGALSTVFVVAVPFLALGLFFIAKKAMPAFTRVFRKYDRLNESIEENVMAMRAVKGFVREDYEREKFEAASKDIEKDFTKAERIVAFNSPIMQACLYMIMLFVLFFGAQIIVTNKATTIDVGQLSAMLTYGMQILMSLMMLSMIYVMITMSAESARRIVEVLNEEPSLKNPENALMEVKDGSVDFTNVSFKYAKTADNFALSDINLHIDSGETVGIIGGTGSSKSTLIQLISRLYDTTEGTVQVGGEDVRLYDLTVLRDSVSVVLQKNLLFAGTIKENLRWGNKEATDEEIVEACRLAQADGFIETFPDGYDTHIEQGGTNVSGGQRQRLCIARALLKRPKILILDDSTSAVDTKTDALIRNGLAKYLPETTKIIIAQRIASVQDADKILVMDTGRIVAMGTHAELMESSPIYREVFTQQTKGGADHAEDAE